ncbi:MAG: tRNA 2-thiouridine(34) synthase MnmA [Acetobacter sp.]|nr:tRNA 2-thiouridine(34) synthase MnmA [Bacteroides sp.]MCM1341452.1 tRNA 2-thiouridine(34) synthase MnmA [Acetobacter sp.]MCM1433404.1 tRNA 2-thiouridine(34) synthase MnmA [Clostridiales bacterium]
MSKKAIIAMSGGVDSSVAAFLMKKKEYECIGATMKLYDNDDIAADTEKTCCSLDDIEDARAVARRLSMPYYVFNFKDEFKEKVIDKFISTYENGGTPNPCIDCNRHLKFEKLFERMNELQFDYVVTGHYAKVEERNGWFYLKKAKDHKKDQSYVLYSLTQNQLAHILFPLGEYSKPEIREIAESEGFLNATKRDSQDICFVTDGDYAKFIESYTGKKYPAGNFVDIHGNVIGRHQGIIRYTNGQRKGLGVAFGKPMYVADKNIENNTVTLCTNEELFSTELFADNFNWLVPDISSPIRCKARVRYNMSEQDATAYIIDENKVKVVFDNPQRAVTKGQAVVLYDEDIVLGGGTIL